MLPGDPFRTDGSRVTLWAEPDMVVAVRLVSPNEVVTVVAVPHALSSFGVVFVACGQDVGWIVRTRSLMPV